MLLEVAVAQVSRAEVWRLKPLVASFWDGYTKEVMFCLHDCRRQCCKNWTGLGRQVWEV